MAYRAPTKCPKSKSSYNSYRSYQNLKSSFPSRKLLFFWGCPSYLGSGFLCCPCSFLAVAFAQSLTHPAAFRPDAHFSPSLPHHHIITSSHHHITTSPPLSSYLLLLTSYRLPLTAYPIPLFLHHLQYLSCSCILHRFNCISVTNFPKFYAH